MTLEEFINKAEAKLKREWKDRSNFTFKMNRLVHRFCIAHSKNHRPASYPYISGDTFRDMADYVYDEFKTFEPAFVKERGIVFVDIHKIKTFFKSLHPYIKNKYILVTHNGDDPITDELAEHIDGKIIMWYGQNVITKNPKVSPIPIGLENVWYYNNGVPKYFDSFRKHVVEKKNRMLYGFTVRTNPTKRQPALDALENNVLADKIKGWPNAKRYLPLLSSYKFVASPEGNGIDCIRTWEAMYMKVVPIVYESLITRYYYDIGLPVYIIKSWKELDTLTEAKLEEKYNELENRFESKALWFDYWQKKIESTK